MKPKNLLSPDFAISECVLGIGMFDGVHLGHQKLIAEVCKTAKALNTRSAVLTFDNAPKKLLYPELFRGYLTDTQEKFDLLTGSGVDEVIFRPFDKNFAKMPYTSFIKDILIDKLRVKAVAVGFNFCFGAERRGNAFLMKTELAKYGRKCLIAEPVSIEGQVVSSSLIREAVANGDFTRAAKFLGRYASFSGTVVHGNKRGREMGFPTANLRLDKTLKVLPPNGVYACYADVGADTFSAMVNVGVRPTFNGTDYLLEAHLLNFSGSLYDKRLKIRFVQMLRCEKRFEGMQQLIKQLHNDKNSCYSILE